ncbi:MAG: carbonic anhydrase [Bacillota bacterium]
MSHSDEGKTVSVETALNILKAGNRRFVNGMYSLKDLGRNKREDLLANGQHPFAVIITCSDSRVPPELLFDQALGDLFVIRVAGNVLDSVSLGSVEYAVDHLHTPLVVVMGHENCGAVHATVEGGDPPGSIGSITALIQPSVEKVRAMGIDGHELCEKATDENVKSTLETLKKSPVIKHLMDEGRLTLVGAKYHIGSGEVIFFD